MQGGLAVALVLAYLWQPPEEHGYQSAYLARADPEYVDTPVARFEYLKTGQGEPVVLVPGGSPGFYDRSLSQVYGGATPNVVRTELSEERILVGVAEGAGISLLLEERAATLRYPGVMYRRVYGPRADRRARRCLRAQPVAGGPALHRPRAGART
jgi:hypothetical protein